MNCPLRNRSCLFARTNVRAIALPLMLALAKCLSFYVKIFYVMGKVLICAFLYEDRSWCMHSVFQNYDSNTQSGLMLHFCHLHGV